MNQTKKINRLVKIENSSVTDDEGKFVPISSILKYESIVLLGEPGSGKSHTFESLSKQESASLITASEFQIYSSTLPKEGILYIDALDETRSRLNKDQSALHNLISQVLPLDLNSFRISCRSADWFGDTDLIKFKRFFEKKGSYIVASLQDLNEEECVEILTNKFNINSTQAAEFTYECKENDSEEFIKTPLGLITLYSVVADKGCWPESKTQLYSMFTQQLLNEHSEHHKLHTVSLPSFDILTEAAGHACALMLISGNAEIQEGNTVPNIPSLTELGELDTGILQALITTKLFKSVLPNLFTYFHRTVAEFLAGKWLADKLNKKELSRNRVLSLILVDGQTPTELRGLVAWLTTFIVDNRELIKSDPLGVLMYGDPKSLNTDSKREILNGLTGLSKQNPYFRANNWSTSYLKGLSTQELVVDFEKILQSSENHHLRSVVYDVLKEGAFFPELEPTLRNVISNVNSPERMSAINAMHLSLSNYQKAQEIYQILSKNRLNSSSITLRIEFLNRYYHYGFKPKDLVGAVNDYIEHCNDETIGYFYCLDEVVSDDELNIILNLISSLPFTIKDDYDRHQYFEVHRFYSRLLARRLEKVAPLNEIQFLYWFRALAKLRGGAYVRENDDSPLLNLLKDKVDLLFSTYSKGMNSLEGKQNGDILVEFDYSFDGYFNYSLPPVLKLDYYLSKLRHGHLNPYSSVFEFYYRAALGISTSDKCYLAEFETLCDLATTNRRIEELRIKYTFDSIKYRLKDSLRRINSEAKKFETKQENIKSFELHQNEIRLGRHSEWLNYLGRIYGGMVTDITDLDFFFRTYLNGQFDQNIAITGFSNLFKEYSVYVYNQLITEVGNNRFHSQFYGFMASINIDWESKKSFSDYPEEQLKTILALAILYRGNPESRFHPKDWHNAILEKNPDLTFQVYNDIITAQLQNNKPQTFYISELLTLENLISQNIHSIFRLLSKYQNQLSIHDINTILVLLIKYYEPKKDLINLALSSLVSFSANINVRPVWYSLLIFLDFPSPPSCVRKHIRKSKAYVWAFIELYKNIRSKIPSLIKNSELQKYAIYLVGESFDNVSHPTGGWSGDKNPWDASSFCRDVISELASDTDPNIENIFNQLIEASKLMSYGDYLKYSLTQHLSYVVESKFKQPSLPETINVLENKSPQNIQDLLAFTIDVFINLKAELKGGSTDTYKAFWNEDRYSRITSPKAEESCRDRLIDLMTPYYTPHNLRVEPEGHMHNDKRADINILSSDMKLPIEIKRQQHNDLWTACYNQLDRLYTIHPESQGHGIYLVFWFGDTNKYRIPKPPQKDIVITSAELLEEELTKIQSSTDNHRLKTVMIDVTG
ncbi:NACHT domain-containing protein [Thiomicrorhabdus xiamenensis]|uniref:Uncharacterized protein n=1 Tax=Thiomicrorhabdus xiamenensis TaxID=2739063 RepID=A0A7D4NQM3_9GAMM|nr:hypothetical protein [Thiomicrorhabdus xiamenensis]QKI88957.1 hypothetical protein HQN79_04915 [Thiomicrorhabdus xiamenensis]